MWVSLLVFLLGMTPEPLRAADYYVVKPGDSVYTVARRLGVSQKALIERNGLSGNQHIYPGQKLAIPPKSSKPKVSVKRPKGPQLPEAVQRAIKTTPVRLGRWKYIVIHHSAVDVGDVSSMDRYHRESRHMENGLAYHFVIGNGNGMGDGEVAVCHRWKEQLDGGHLASEEMNRIALGICLVGNFDERLPSARQMESLRALVRALMARCKISARAVKSHQEINVVTTRCPGVRFPMKSFLRSL
jgi:murein DD-endopeptidase MepM/ murein hydrolase activator NlpD